MYFVLKQEVTGLRISHDAELHNLHAFEYSVKVNILKI
jgi:hypothetical protein